MPSSSLWAVDSGGRVLTLATNASSWQELPYSGIHLKRVSALRSCWGVASDHQIYVYVPQGDIAIRVPEITYENQRWNPKEGFCSRLLPTDRPAWSSKDGLTARFKDSIQLPSSGWQWEGRWYIEDTIDGQPLGNEGWSYCVDFPFTYTLEKKWNSMVRRRKWLRHRRYVATDRWAKIESIHSDPILEPFVDVAVGGNEILGGEPDRVAVWAVTVLGRVMFRENVTRLCPEGEGWTHVPVPECSEVNQISVGPTGLTWAISWNGCALVRLGVSRENYAGTSWADLNAPEVNEKLQQVSVGRNTVWAVGRNGTVWFRKGIHGENLSCRASIMGSGWVKMVGEMAMVTVGPNDQVWGITRQGRRLCLRLGVTLHEASGREWKEIGVPVGGVPSRTSSASSLVSLGSLRPPSTPKHWQHQDSDGQHLGPSSNGFQTDVLGTSVDVQETPLNLHTTLTDGQGVLTNVRDTPTSVQGTLMSSRRTSAGVVEKLNGLLGTSLDAALTADVSRSLSDMTVSASVQARSMPDLQGTFLQESLQFRETGTGYVSIRRQDQASSLTERALAHLSSKDELTIGIDITLSEDWCAAQDPPGSVVWSWVCGSACTIDYPVTVPAWFSPTGAAEKDCDQLESPRWRSAVLTLLQNRRHRETDQFSYEFAIENSTWIKSALVHLWRDTRPCQWVRCKLELERHASETETCDSAILRLAYHHGNSDKKMMVNMAEVCSVAEIYGRERRLVCIFTETLNNKRSFLKLAFNSDLELEDWVATLNVVAGETRDFSSPAGKAALWSISPRGDLFVHVCTDADGSTALQDLFWRHLGGGSFRMVESCELGVTWALGHDNTPWAYTGGLGGGIFKGATGHNVGVSPMSDVKCVCIYENQRWNPFSGFSSRGLPTDRYMWSDKTGLVECTKQGTKLDSRHWHWISDWAVDYRTPEGVDGDGWQYAPDFPFSYHAYKGLTDYVRRRRWFRLCKLYTSGPWAEVEPMPLRDISLLADPNVGNNGSVVLWALSSNGEVVCRMGVSPECPKGTCWVHVPAEQEFKSISVGGGLRVWAVGCDGSAYLRNGISPEIPTGTAWLHVEPPASGSSLVQISAGREVVCAVDSSRKLWCRVEIMDIFPEGTGWVLISDHVWSVSVGSHDQIWAVLEVVLDRRNVLARREGISEDIPVGTHWETAFGMSWQHVSIRGCSSPLAKSQLVS